MDQLWAVYPCQRWKDLKNNPEFDLEILEIMEINGEELRWCTNLEIVTGIFKLCLMELLDKTLPAILLLTISVSLMAYAQIQKELLQARHKQLRSLLHQKQQGQHQQQFDHRLLQQVESNTGLECLVSTLLDE